MIRRLTLLAIALSAAFLVIGFVLSRTVNGIFASLLVGLLWVVLELLHKQWAASPAMALLVVIAVLGASQEYYAVFHVLAVAAALSAWDLSRFSRRLKMVEDDPIWSDATRRHVRRLLWVNGVGLLSAALAISVQSGSGFFLAWFLAVGAVVALFILVMRMAKMTQ
jgi:hypothetical protein